MGNSQDDTVIVFRHWKCFFNLLKQTYLYTEFEHIWYEMLVLSISSFKVLVMSMIDLYMCNGYYYYLCKCNKICFISFIVIAGDFCQNGMLIQNTRGTD